VGLTSHRKDSGKLRNVIKGLELTRSYGMMTWAGHVVLIREMRNSYISVEERQERRPLLKCSCIWEDNIRMDLI
jgi:hypothetical protein